MCTSGSDLGLCISSSMKCDTIPQCYDGEDEEGCRKYIDSVALRQGHVSVLDYFKSQRKHASYILRRLKLQFSRG